MLAAATINTSAITLARQARYYSATLAVTAVCGLLLVRMVTRGGRRDFALGGVMFALLFHTNLVALAGMAAAFAACVPLLARQPRLLEKASLLAGVFALGVLPWVVATGFVDSAAGLPPARALLGVAEVIDYLRQRIPFVAVAAATLGWLIAIDVFRTRVPERLRRPFAHSRPIFTVLLAWTTSSFIAFQLLVPAASYFPSRLSLILLVPSLLFGATLFAALARTVTRHHSPLLASTFFALLLGLLGTATGWFPLAMEAGRPPLFDVVEHLQGLAMPSGTRVYGDTGTALQLTFYSGLPVQSVLPVRRSFFDTYAGEVLIVEGRRRRHR